MIIAGGLASAGLRRRGGTLFYLAPNRGVSTIDYHY
jgi:hypothetical protein